MDGVLRSETEQNVVAYCVLYDVPAHGRIILNG